MIVGVRSLLGACEQVQIGSGCMDTGPYHLVGALHALSLVGNTHSGSSLLFAVTAAFSIYGVSYYRKNGSSPEYSVQDAGHLPIEHHDFSAGTNLRTCSLIPRTEPKPDSRT